MRVAVIGHGASAEGAGLGRVIDGCGLVVRLHDCHWQEAEDYGARWDVGVLPGPWNRRWEKDRRGAPTVEWWAYRLSTQNDIPAEVAGLRVRVSNLAPIGNRVRRKGMTKSAPTRGLSACLMALRFVKPSVLLLVGFDGIRDGQRTGQPYTDAQGRVSPPIAQENREKRGGIIQGPHHFGAERAVLLASAREARCELTFLP